MTVVQGWRGDRVRVGSKVLYGSPPAQGEKDERGNTVADYLATVIEIVDPDADVDDDTGRTIQIPAAVKIRFDTTSEEETVSTSFSGYIGGDIHGEDCWLVSDLEIAKEAQRV